VSTPDIRKALADLLTLEADGKHADECAIEAWERARAALAAPGQAPQPVAWRYQDARGHFRYRAYKPGFDVEYAILKPAPLYAGASPQAAVPAGFVLVPIESTPAMRYALECAAPAEVRWAKVIAARPQAQPTPTDTPT
jgi:hypothetical protein